MDKQAASKFKNQWTTAILNKSMSSQAKAVGFALGLRMNLKDLAYSTSYEALEDDTGLGKSSVRKGIKELEDRGFVTSSVHKIVGNKKWIKYSFVPQTDLEREKRQKAAPKGGRKTSPFVPQTEPVCPTNRVRLSDNTQPYNTNTYDGEPYNNTIVREDSSPIWKSKKAKNLADY